MVSFNPCFSGTTTYTSLSNSIQTGRWVSILVFLEPPLIPLRVIEEILTTGVSILVFLEPPLILEKKSKKEAKNADVSILVFLEPPLILYQITTSSFNSIRFNPCFSGTTTYTGLIGEFKHKKEGFNPCFSGTTTYTPAWPGFRNSRVDVSILVFLEPPLIPRRFPEIPYASCCFNPCFSGTTTYTLSIPVYRERKISFNPCFSGTTTYTSAMRLQKGLASSFNPCFSGTTTYT